LLHLQQSSGVLLARFVRSVSHRVAGLLLPGRLDSMQILRLRFFAHDGFTEDAEALMQKNWVLWSVSDDLDVLLKHLRLRQLPEFADEKIAY